VFRALGVGVPTLDSLFVDPLQEPVLFKVFNRNLHTWVLGLFNSRHVDGTSEVSGNLCPDDVHGIAGDTFAVYCHRSDELAVMDRREQRSLTLGELQAEVATLARLDRGVAALGLKNMLNGGAAVQAAEWRDDRFYARISHAGQFLAASERRPLEVYVNGASVPFEYARGRLELTLSNPGCHDVELRF
jgi:hypothetical protein